MPQDGPALEGLRVLVVDDDEDYRAIVAGTLARSGLDVVTAGTAEEALAACRKEPPALILMDVWMPGQGGIRTCAQLRDAPSFSGVPIILMSAQWQSDRHVAKAVEAGASDVLSKERTAMELMARVRAALAHADALADRPGGKRPAEDVGELLAICAGCKRVRDEHGEWEAIDACLRRVTGRELTHGICPGCRQRIYGAAGGPAVIDPGGGGESESP